MAGILVVWLIHGCVGTGGGPFHDDDLSGDSDVDSDSDSGTDEEPRAPQIGVGDHSSASVELVAVIDEADLDFPTGIGFPSNTPGDLWVVDRGDDGWTILEDVAGAATEVFRFWDDSGPHFLNDPSSVSFSTDEAIAGTCQDNFNDYNGKLGPYYANGFMGPVEWTTDREHFGGGAMSHYDMLHEEPFCKGIAWAEAHVFWTFNGYDESLDRVDFHDWHPDAPGGLGGQDHSDGEIFRYVEGELSPADEIPSHLVHNPADGYVYVNDTGAGRIVRLDATPKSGDPIVGRINEPGVRMYRCAGDLETVVPPGELTSPSGIALGTDATGTLLFVTDWATGEVKALTTDGELVNWLDTGLGEGLSGIALSEDGTVYVAQSLENRIYRIDPIVPPQG